MTHQHTSGPWIVTKPDTDVKLLDVFRADGTCRSRIARLHADLLCEEHGGSIEANARLIAAAPELLAMLTEAIRIADSGRVMPCDTIRAARATIAKATL